MSSTTMAPKQRIPNKNFLNLTIGIVLWVVTAVSASELKPHSFKGSWAFTWDDPKRTLFDCRALDSSDKPIFYGSEISFRKNDTEDGLASCRSWIHASTSLVNQSNLDSIKSHSNKWTIQGEGTFKEINSIVFEKVNLTGPDFGGWFRVTGDEYFSEGVYVSPLFSKPKVGVKSYGGVVYSAGGEYLSPKSMSVNFSNNTIDIIFSTIIRLGDPDIPLTGKKEIRTISPIKFDPITGRFTGEMIEKTLFRQGMVNVIQRKVAVSGAVGGKGGRIIVGIMHNGKDIPVLNIENPIGFEFFVLVDK